jgi:hypothetical protein
VGACNRGSGAASPGDRAHPQEGEVFLEPLAEPGPNPFTLSVAVAAVPPVSAGNPPTSGQGLRTVQGTDAGLYAGSGSQPACDPTAAINFLVDHPDNSLAWTDALNDDPGLSWSGGAKLAVSDVPAYVGELTSVFLRTDTRVTDHGFVSGHAVAFQSVLQRGTAVMVDTQGVPRARCANLGPLAAPKPAKSPKYRGTPWSGFDERRLVRIAAGREVTTLRVVDVHTHKVIEIFVGQSCVCDRTKAPTNTTSTTLFDETPTTTGRTTTTLKKTTTTTTTTGHGSTTSTASTTTSTPTTQPTTTTTTTTTAP